LITLIEQLTAMDDIATRPKPAKTKLSQWQRLALWLGIGTVLYGILMLYTKPDFLVMLSNQLWSCF
jgi:hypothetical protein